jgi:hemerythrin-like domain-containing protein
MTRGTLLDFFKTFADRCHHRKEEQVLFPKLVALGIPVNDGPLGVMLYEHDQARLLIRAMEEAADTGHPGDFALFAEQYADLLEGHIAKEDNILFRRADSLLTAADDESLFRRFDDIEREMGAEAHEKFHRILQTLAARYLKEPSPARAN